MTMLASVLMASAAALAIAIACSGGTLAAPPSSGAVATFAAGSETFRVSLTTAD
jgi:hypothetical protein